MFSQCVYSQGFCCCCCCFLCFVLFFFFFLHDFQRFVRIVVFLTIILSQDCTFNKLTSNTALKVSFQGNLRSETSDGCNRWYFKFNGNECNGPMTIDAVVYNRWPSGRAANQLHHRSFEGYCENIPQGTVRVELWVGKCPSHTLGSAYTGWNSVSRIILEEVSRPQS